MRYNVLRPVVALAAVAAMLILAPVGRADENKEKTADKTVLPVFRLRGAITETPIDESFPVMVEKTIPLKELTTRINKAKDDKAVKAIVLMMQDAHFGLAQAEELRQAIGNFRSSGKDVYAFTDQITMPKYMVLSGVSRLSVVPTGDVWLNGLYTESPYLRGMLTRIGVTPDFLTCGAYKSAAEVFMREGPSKESEEMHNWLFDSLFDTEVKNMAKGRGVEPAKVREWIDQGLCSARKAKELGIVDEVQHREDFEAFLKDRLGRDVKFDHRYGAKIQEDLDLSSPFAVLNLWSEILSSAKKKSHKDSIAVVYVEGPIVLGDPDASPFGNAAIAASDPLRKALDKAADDDTIKAVVLRIDSPGGSATASEIILNATKRVNAKKPFVVSMGDIAGSGGYYVACGTDTIFADEATLTGSIGVVGGKLATSDMWDKLSIHWKAYKRGAQADILSSAQPFTPEQRKYVQSWMDEIYGVFKQHVVDARLDKLKKPIDEMAGGRVYTGRQALELGLVDKIGTLQDAIQLAAERAKISDYEVRVVPEPKNFLEVLLKDISGGDNDPKRLALGAAAREPSLWPVALPYLQKLDPQRVEAILVALGRLDMLRQEGAVLMMPEMVVRGR